MHDITLRQETGDHTKLPNPAMGATRVLNVRHALHEVGDRLDHRRLRGWYIERGTCRSQRVLLARRRQQAVVPDALDRK